MVRCALAGSNDRSRLGTAAVLGALATLAMVAVSSCASTGAGQDARATTSLPAVLGSTAPGTPAGSRAVPPAVATTPTPPPTVVTTQAASTSSMPPSSVPSGARTQQPHVADRPDTWLVAGSVTGDKNASTIVYSDAVSVCVGVRQSIGGTRDACGDVGTEWSAVLATPDRLYVVAVRRPDGHLAVESTTGAYDVVPLPAGAAAPRPFAVAALALAPGADVVRLDGGDETTPCSYRALSTSLAASGTVGDLPVPLHIDQCRPSAVSAQLLGSSRALQGAEALFDRAPDGQWEVVNVGGNLCGDQGSIDPATLTEGQQAAIERTAAICRALGR